MREKLLRDPIHDLIVFDLDKREDRVLLSAIDTAEVQRLRRVKQLGMAHMAYQGAEHSRFSHSIGVLHMVRRMLGRLTQEHPLEPIQALAVQAAGLLHDLGHGPFSHVMEKFFREHHETWTERVLLSQETEINGVLRSYSAELPELVARVLSGDAEPRWINSVVSSQLDADRFDYLLRDSHMTGVKYGIFDLERLLMMLRVAHDGQRVVVAAKGLVPLEKYLQSRFQMYRQVYFHKTVTSAEAMLMAVLDRASDLARDGSLSDVAVGSPLWKLLTRGTLDVPEFLDLDDAILLSAMNAWRRSGDAILRDLSTRLLGRRIFKAVEIETSEEEDLLFSARVTAAREYLESHGLDHRYYLRFSRSRDTPYKPYSPRGGSSTIFIEDPADRTKLRDVAEVSKTIRAFMESGYTLHRAFFPDFAQGIPVREKLTEILKG